MEPTHEQGVGHDEFHDNLIPDSWQRDSNKQVQRNAYNQGRRACIRFGEPALIPVVAPQHEEQRHEYDEEDEGDEEEDITGPGKLPFRSRRYDLVPDDAEFADPLASPPVPLTSAAYRYRGASLEMAPLSDRRDFRRAEPSPFTPGDEEHLIPQHGIKPAMWTPKWLEKTTLLIFTAVFVLLLVGTALVYHFSQRSNGLGMQRESNHYLWRCIPTAGKSGTSRILNSSH